MQAGTVRAVLVVALMAVVGCGGGGGASGSGGSPGSGGTSSCDGGCWRPTANETAFISSFCALMDTCCGTDASPYGFGSTMCTTQLQESGVTGDASLEAACLSELQSLASTTSCVPAASDLTDPCLRVFYEPSGPRQPGEPCAYRSDCAGSPGTVTSCGIDPSLPGGIGHGICIQMTPGKAGDHTCLGGSTADGIITYAAFYTGTGKPIVTGALCLATDGLYCNQTNDPTTTACTTLVADGGACISSTTCASGKCLAANGGLAQGTPGTCEPTVSTGASCVDAVCDGVSYCDSSTASPPVCTARLATGAACYADQQCPSGNCDSSSVCSARSSSERLAMSLFCGGFI